MGLETALGLALAVAGTGMQMASAAKSKSAMNKSLLSSLRKQEEFQRRATPLANEVIQESGPGRDVVDRAEGKAAHLARLGEADKPLGTAFLPTTTRTTTLRDMGREAGGEVEGYNSANFNRWLRTNRSMENLRVISNLAQTSAGSAPVLAQLAGNKGATLGAIGSLVSTAGNLAGIYGGLKAGQAASVPGTSGGHSNSRFLPLKGA